MHYFNQTVGKQILKALLVVVAYNFGSTQATIINDKVKNIAFQASTYSGASLSLQDFSPAPPMDTLLNLANAIAQKSDSSHCNGVMSFYERHAFIMTSWRAAIAPLTDILQIYMLRCNSLSSLYFISFSGARGNITQVKQLLGIRGLIMDVYGKIGELPIRTNLFTGMKALEITISAHGSRKGLVDTGLRTADAGYLTRRLVDATHNILIREEDCFGKDYLTISEMFFHSIFGQGREYLWRERIVGRTLKSRLFLKNRGRPNWDLDLKQNTIITKYLLATLKRRV